MRLLNKTNTQLIRTANRTFTNPFCCLFSKAIIFSGAKKVCKFPCPPVCIDLCLLTYVYLRPHKKQKTSLDRNLGYRYSKIISVISTRQN